MGVFMATITGSLFGQTIQNVIHFDKNPSTDEDKGALAIAIRDRWLAQIKFACTSHMQWTQIRVEKSPGPDDQPAILPVVVGGFQGAPVGIAPFVCAVFKLKTGIAGKKGRGRFYISGVDALGLEGGRWNAQQMINFRSIADSLMQWFGGSSSQTGFRVGVAGRNLDQSSFKEVTDIVPRNVPGVQVRRNIGRGS